MNVNCLLPCCINQFINEFNQYLLSVCFMPAWRWWKGDEDPGAVLKKLKRETDIQTTWFQKSWFQKLSSDCWVQALSAGWTGGWCHDLSLHHVHFAQMHWRNMLQGQGLFFFSLADTVLFSSRPDLSFWSHSGEFHEVTWYSTFVSAAWLVSSAPSSLSLSPSSFSLSWCLLFPSLSSFHSFHKVLCTAC